MKKTNVGKNVRKKRTGDEQEKDGKLSNNKCL